MVVGTTGWYDHLDQARQALFSAQRDLLALETNYQDRLDAWNREFPQKPLAITMEEYPNQEMHNKLLLSLQSGVGAPDFVDININYFANCLKGTPQLADLTRVAAPVRNKFIQSRFEISPYGLRVRTATAPLSCCAPVTQ